MNIEIEERLLNLFGYKAIGPDNSNRYKIVDENNNSVGFIQKKKIHNKNIKKGMDAVFGYYTEIDSPIVKCSKIRKINNTDDKLLNNDNFSYELNIKNDKGDWDEVNIDLENNISLTIWSHEYGFIEFYINYDTLYLNFKSKTENYNIEETTVVKLSEDNRNNLLYAKSYGYCISFCDIKNDINSKVGRTTLDINFDYKPLYFSDSGKIEIKQLNWKDGNLIKKNSSIVDGTIEEAISKHKMGIDSFKHFRYLVNKIFPFKQEIISSMLKEREMFEPVLTLFIQGISSKNIDNEKILEFKNKH